MSIEKSVKSFCLCTAFYTFFYFGNHHFPIYSIRERGRVEQCDFIGSGSHDIVAKNERWGFVIRDVCEDHPVLAITTPKRTPPYFCINQKEKGQV